MTEMAGVEKRYQLCDLYNADLRVKDPVLRKLCSKYKTPMIQVTWLEHGHIIRRLRNGVWSSQYFKY